MRASGENGEMVALFDWIRTQPALANCSIHIPNERKSSPQYGALLKRMGVRSGVSDVFIACPKGPYCGMWLEMKYAKGKLTVNQKQFLEDMSAQGYYAVCVTGFEAAQAFIQEYMGL